MAKAPIEVINVAVGVLACSRREGHISAVDAARKLDRMELLRDSRDRPGLPLRNHLRAGRISNARQEGVFWRIDRDPVVCGAIQDKGGVTKPLADPWEELVSAIDALRRSSDRLQRQTEEQRGDLEHTSGWHANSVRRLEVAIERVGGPVGVARLAEERRARATAKPSRVGEDWSAAEDAAIVADYLAMLDDEQHGRRYSKAAHRRALLPKLAGRNEGAIEFRHANISEAMQRLGLPAIKGYLPRGTIQGALIEEITRQTRGGETIRESEATAPVPVTIGPARFVEAPLRSQRSGGKKGQAALRTPDYGALQEENRKLGRTGEEVVVAMERARLRDGGRSDLAKRVKNIAAELGDGAGYDVRSSELDGSPLHIEVKSTRGGASTPFYLSASERKFADDNPDSARLYRVYDLGPDPKVYVVRPPYESELTLEVVMYRARR